MRKSPKSCVAKQRVLSAKHGPIGSNGATSTPIDPRAGDPPRARRKKHGPIGVDGPTGTPIDSRAGDPPPQGS